jgi:hypothetical protein
MLNCWYIYWPLCGTYSDHCAVHILTTVRYIYWPLCGTYSDHCAVHIVTSGLAFHRVTNLLLAYLQKTGSRREVFWAAKPSEVNDSANCRLKTEPAHRLTVGVLSVASGVLWGTEFVLLYCKDRSGLNRGTNAFSSRPVMKLWAVLAQRHKEVQDGHCEAFLCVAGKSESYTSFSGDRFLLYDTIFDLRQLCLNGWWFKPH